VSVCNTLRKMYCSCLSAMKGDMEMNTYWFLVLSCCAQVFFLATFCSCGRLEVESGLESGVRGTCAFRFGGLEVSSTRIETLARYGICKGLFLRFSYDSLM